jgi:ubiquinone/menaquinone biosynthesis C-methylase UbiE
MDRLQAGLNALIARQVEPGLRILDAGCGAGNLSLRLAQQAREVVGVDHSAAMLAQAEARSQRAGLTNLRLIEADLASGLGDQADGSFDLAVMVMVLHEMPHPTRTAVLRELTRLARRALLVDFVVPQPWNLAGLRNRTIEVLAGATHHRAFRDYCARGGLPSIATESVISLEVLRLVDSRTLGFFQLSR